MSVRRKLVASAGDRSIVLMDSISYADRSDQGAFVISASHGGKSSAHIACLLPLAGVVFNDAGIGKNNAGIAGLEMLDAHNMPALTVSNESAHIGDVEDAWQHGTISRTNSAATRAGFKVGQLLRESVLNWLDEAAG
jgi:hypothetical protein